MIGSKALDPGLDYTSNNHGNCPAGYYCPLGTESPYQFPCRKGKYNPNPGRNSENDCVDCPEGMFCAQEGLDAPSGDCSAGYYCEAGSIESTSRKCGVGNYCPQGSSAPTECPEGKYCPGSTMSDNTGLQDVFETLASGAGKWDCWPGYFCDVGQRVPIPSTGRCYKVFYRINIRFN